MTSHWYSIMNLSVFTTTAYGREKGAKFSTTSQYDVCEFCHETFSKPRCVHFQYYVSMYYYIRYNISTLFILAVIFETEGRNKRPNI